eukprot:g28063.t1
MLTDSTSSGELAADVLILHTFHLSALPSFVLLLFEIISENHSSLSLAQPLDFETKRSYTLKVEAGNAHIDPRFISKGPFKDTAAVKITVEDADEPPVFSLPAYFLEVRESVNVGSDIGQIMARDPDIVISPI